MKVALCLITRLGNKYLREWVGYYKKLGFDKIFIYDNHRYGEEKCLDEIPYYVNEGFVEITNWDKYKGKIQEPAYQNCYDLHGNEYDWIAYFDDDEYLVLNTTDNVKEFLSMQIFEGRNGVSFPMINYCDCDLIVNNKKTRLDVYTDVKDKNNLYSNSFYKTITRGRLNATFIISDDINGVRYDYGAHCPMIDNIVDNNFVDCDGNLLIKNGSPVTQFPVRNAFIKHIPTGCIDDFLKIRRKRGWPALDSREQIDKENTFDYNYFLQYNNDSEEKRAYYEKYKSKK